MSFEAPFISVFQGVDEIESVMAQIRLAVNRGYGQRELLEYGETLRIPSMEVRQVGLRLDFSALSKSLLTAVSKSLVPTDAVDLFVIAEGRFLKDRTVLGRRPIGELEDEWILIEHGKVRQDALRDRKHGFAIHVAAILTRPLDPLPRRPRRLGTVLGHTTFRVSPSPLGSGLKPKPLTSQVAETNGIAKGAMLFVSQESDLVNADNLEEALSIYVDEKLYTELGRNKSREARLVQVSLALEAIGQLTYLFSAELQGSSEVSDEIEKSVVFEFLISNYRKVCSPRKIETEEFHNLLLRNPAVVAASLSANKQLASAWRELLTDEGE